MFDQRESTFTKQSNDHKLEPTKEHLFVNCNRFVNSYHRKQVVLWGASNYTSRRRQVDFVARQDRESERESGDSDCQASRQV